MYSSVNGLPIDVRFRLVECTTSKPQTSGTRVFALRLRWTWTAVTWRSCTSSRSTRRSCLRFALQLSLEVLAYCTRKHTSTFAARDSERIAQHSRMMSCACRRCSRWRTPRTPRSFCSITANASSTCSAQRSTRSSAPFRYSTSYTRSFSFAFQTGTLQPVHTHACLLSCCLERFGHQILYLILQLFMQEKFPTVRHIDIEINWNYWDHIKTLSLMFSFHISWSSAYTVQILYEIVLYSVNCRFC